MRAQTELPAMGIAFVLLTAALMLGVAGANSAFSSADRSALERQAAVSISGELVDEDSALTARENVLREAAVAVFNGSGLHGQYPVPDGADVRVVLDGKQIARTGPIATADARTIERVVLVENRTRTVMQPRLERSRAVTLPRRTFNTTVRISPPADTLVRSVRVNDRVVLRNTSGLVGAFTLDLSRLETTRLWFEAAGPLPPGSIELVYETPETRKAVLAVTVDA